MYKGKGQVEKSCNVFGSLAPPHLASIVNQSPRLKESNHKTTYWQLHFSHASSCDRKKKTAKIVSEERNKMNQNSSVLHFLLRCVWNENLRIIINKNSQNWCLQRTHAFCFIVLKNPQRRRCTFFFRF